MKTYLRGKFVDLSIRYHPPVSCDQVVTLPRRSYLARFGSILLRLMRYFDFKVLLLIICTLALGFIIESIYTVDQIMLDEEDSAPVLERIVEVRI